MSVTVLGPRDPLHPDAVNVTSRSHDWGRSLSPFLLGPCELYDGYIAKNVENAWQFSKLYAEHADENQEPTADYWTWATQGWADARAHRYPMGRGAKPLCSFWNGKRYAYLDSKRLIYIPLYARAVARSSAFMNLKRLYETIGEIVLWDFDAYDHRSKSMNWKNVIESEKYKYGHGMVLGMMLEGFVTEDGEIIEENQYGQ